MKKRLTGAIVLVALIVIFVPMLVEERKLDFDLGLNEQIPEQPDEKFRDDLVPNQDVIQLDQNEPVDKPRYDLPVSEGKSTQMPTDINTSSLTEDNQNNILPTLTSPPIPPKPTVTTGEVVTAGWVIQAGSFGQRENATKLKSDLKQSGYESFIEPIDVSGKTLYRVRIGPYAERATADQQLAVIESTLHIKGSIVAFP